MKVKELDRLVSSIREQIESIDEYKHSLHVSQEGELEECISKLSIVETILDEVSDIITDCYEY